MIGYERVAVQAPIASMALNYEFVYPLKGSSDFFISFDRSTSFETVDVFFDSMYPDANIRPAHVIPPDAGLPKDRNYFEITHLVDPFISSKVWTGEIVPGPNCYQSALASLGYDALAGRYVHDDEFSYYLTRDFKIVDARSALPQSIVVYLRSGRPMASSFAMSSLLFTARAAGVLYRDRDAVGDIPELVGASRSHALRRGAIHAAKRPPDGKRLGIAPSQEIILGYDHGEHAAVLLAPGLVFQKGCFGDYCPYKIVPANKAMSSIEMRAKDRFEPPPEPERDEYFRTAYYAPLADGEKKDFGLNQELNAKLARYLPLIEYYGARLRTAKDLSWAEYKKGRVELLACENMWAVFREIDRELSRELGAESALLRIDRGLAEAYLEAVSLDWQNQAMALKFWPFSDRWSDERFGQELRTLYREKYVDVSSENFRREVEAHLEFRGVTPDRWQAIVKEVRAKVGEYDVEALAPSNGSDGIPFFEILAKATANN